MRGGKLCRKSAEQPRQPRKKNRSRNESLGRDGPAGINFLPLSPAGTCVFMRHSEAYKRRAISDTIKMCISRRCFKRNPGPGAPTRNSGHDVRARPAYFTSARRVLFPYSVSLFYLPEEIIIQPPRSQARFNPLALPSQLIPLFTILHGTDFTARRPSSGRGAAVCIESFDGSRIVVCPRISGDMKCGERLGRNVHELVLSA